MKAHITAIAGIALLSLLPSLAFSQQSPQVGAADTDSGFACMFMVLVGGEGSYTPVYPNGAGIIHVPVSQDIRAVYTNSTAHSKALNCIAQITPGSTVSGYDHSTGQTVAGAALSLKDICDSATGAAPALCNPGQTATISSANYPFACQLPGPNASVAHWRQGISHSGGYSLNCSAEGE